jgi:hypothetical protein
MDWNWLWQSVVSRLLWAVLVFLGGALLAFIRPKWPRLASALMYGLVAAACLGVLFFVFTGRAVLSRETPQTTPQNVEQNVRAWVDRWGLAIQTQPQPTNPPTRFMLLVRLPNEDPVYIAQLTANDRYLQIQGTVSLGPDLVALINKLSKDQLIRLEFEVMQELALAKMVYKLNMSGDKINSITVTQTVPITSQLTEDAFVSLLNDMSSDLVLARTTIALDLHTEPLGH